MAQPTQQHITQLLQAAADGDPTAAAEILPIVYDDLRRYASNLLANEHLVGSATLQPTLLVHEAYIRLTGGFPDDKGVDRSWDGRRHFFGAAARAMRQILVDRARQIRAARPPLKRNVDPAEITIPGTASLPHDPEELLALDVALNDLAQRSSRQHDVVMLRYFAGLTIEETARALGVSTGTVKSEWMYARAWLLRCLESHRAQDV